MSKPKQISMLVVTVMSDKDNNYHVRAREEHYSVSGNSQTSHTIKRIVDGSVSTPHQRIQASQLMQIDKAGFLNRVDAAFYRIYFDSTKTDEAVEFLRTFITSDLQSRVSNSISMQRAWVNRKTQ